MRASTKLAILALTTLVMSTSLASGLEMALSRADEVGNVLDAIQSSSPTDSINDAVQPSSPTDSINDAVQPSNPIVRVNDAVITHPKERKPDLVFTRVRPSEQADGQIGLAFACEASGTELLTLRNKGDLVPAGTKVRWEVKSLGERGAVRLKTALGQGDKVRVDIGMDVDAGTPCAARAI